MTRRTSSCACEHGDPRSRQSGVVPAFSPAHVIAGEPYVTDRLIVRAHEVALRRHVLTFFQGNRYLLNDLVAHVVGLVEEGSTVVDCTRARVCLPSAPPSRAARA